MVRLPWVSRSQHEHVVSILQDVIKDCCRERNQANSRADFSRAQTKEYVDKMLAMRLQNGGDPVYPDVEPVKDSLDSGIRSAINEMEVDEQPYLEEFAQGQIAAGKSPESIIDSIHAGLEFQP